jgi:hypothetical protein
MFMPREPGQRRRQTGQLVQECAGAIMIADDEMNLTTRIFRGEIPQPAYRGGQSLFSIAQRTPAEIENVTVQHQHIGGPQLVADGIEARSPARPAGEQVQIGNHDSSSGVWLAIGTHVEFHYTDSRLNGREIFGFIWKSELLVAGSALK